MSTILKALRRLEEEKTRGGSQRPLREEVASGPGEQPSRRWTSLLPVLALLIGAGVGASAWWLWPYGPSLGGADAAAAAAPGGLEPVAAAPDPKRTPPPVALQPSMPSVPQPEPGIAPELPFEAAPELEEFGPPEDAFASDVEVVERPQPTPRIEPAPEPSVAAAPVPPLPAAPPDPQVEPPAVRVAEAKRSEAARAAKAKAAAPESTRVARAPIDAPPPAVLVSEPAEPEPALEAEPAPRRAEPERAPVAMAAAPNSEIYVTRTQWHPERGRRSADLRYDGQSRNVHEGDVVLGYEVSEIKPSGVVLTRGDERIDQKIGKPPAAQ